MIQNGCEQNTHDLVFGARPPKTAWPRVVSVTRFPDQYLSEYAPLFLHGPKMRAIKAIIEEVADTNATVLIRGESGAGKEVVARAILAASRRASQPFIKVNCAALPAELLESELFGHEQGAFTGAYRRELGKFEAANKGTLFLDEIGDLPLALQAKLLHVLQDREFSRVGGREMIRVDTRIIASTNKNLDLALRNGEFREDLYYRLNVVDIHVPPLRERKEEILPLVRYFLEKFKSPSQREFVLQPEVLDLLTEYPWPGNVREVENIVRRLVVLGHVPRAYEDVVTSLRTPPPARRAESQPGPQTVAPGSNVEPSLGLREIARRAARDAERSALQEALDRVHWNRTEAARLLKVSYKTLLCKMIHCGLRSKQPPPEAA